MMNQLLIQMLTARAGGAASPALTELLTRMNSSTAPSSGANIEELLAQQASANPMAAMLIKQLTDQRHRAALEEARVIDVEPMHDTRVASDQGATDDCDRGQFEALHERVNTLMAEVELLQQRTDTFAAAVGACCLCWGKKSDCRGCRGRGGPGFCIPDETLFERLVLPAIRTLRAQRANHSGSSQTMDARTASA
jgi:hypothetical protein